MILTFIAAIGKNNELGKNNNLVWRLPADLQHFHERTMGHTIIMGRKTFESIGRILPNRRHIIITRDKNYLRHSVDVVHSLEEALDLVKNNKDEVFIIGGAEIFKQAMDLADRLDITHIEAEDKNADTFFPEIIPAMWKEISHEEHKKDEKNPLDYTFSIYEKLTKE
jgi:dihydrofolate reductase